MILSISNSKGTNCMVLHFVNPKVAFYCVYYHRFFVYFPVFTHLVCFQILAIVNIRVQISVFNRINEILGVDTGLYSYLFLISYYFPKRLNESTFPPSLNEEPFFPYTWPQRILVSVICDVSLEISFFYFINTF